MKTSSPTKQPLPQKRGIFLSASFCFIFFFLFLFDWDQFRQNRRQDSKIASLSRHYSELSNRFDRKPSHRLPRSIIIGARKCGTRALLEALELHPDVKTARYEVHFFDQNDTYNRGYDWYKSQFPETYPWQIPMEKTPGYFTSSIAPERIFNMNSTIKLILIVRNPVTRAISDYTQVHSTKLSKGKRHDSFERLVFDPVSGELNTDYKPIRNSLYAKHIRRWLRYFPLENLFLVDGDKFISDPLPELKKVEKFLGLEPRIDGRHLYFNRTKGFYCFKPTPEATPRCLGDTKGRPHVQVLNKTQSRLRTLLLPYNEKFFQIVGKVFDW